MKNREVGEMMPKKLSMDMGHISRYPFTGARQIITPNIEKMVMLMVLFHGKREFATNFGRNRAYGPKEAEIHGVSLRLDEIPATDFNNRLRLLSSIDKRWSKHKNLNVGEREGDQISVDKDLIGVDSNIIPPWSLLIRSQDGLFN